MLRHLDDPADDKSEIAAGLIWQAGWELSSKNYSFGGFSALMVRDNGRLIAVSDSSRAMEFSPRDNHAQPAVFHSLRDSQLVERKATDLESVVPDQNAGGFWAGFERRNLIARYDANRKVVGLHAPGAMQDWSFNSGAEAMTRLTSGEFLIVPEGPRSWFSEIHEALVFEGDPVEDAESAAVEIVIGGGFRPVDAVTLPDGRIMLLLRDFSIGFPPSFESALMIGRLTKEKGAWAWQTDETFPLAGPIPPENYEGLAVVQREDGSADLWLISDNNMSVLQHTYLIKLGLRPKEKARGDAAR